MRVGTEIEGQRAAVQVKLDTRRNQQRMPRDFIADDRFQHGAGYRRRLTDTHRPAPMPNHRLLQRRAVINRNDQRLRFRQIIRGIDTPHRNQQQIRKENRQHHNTDFNLTCYTSELMCSFLNLQKTI